VNGPTPRQVRLFDLMKLLVLIGLAVLLGALVVGQGVGATVLEF
jgi:hypothetical protein